MRKRATLLAALLVLAVPDAAVGQPAGFTFPPEWAPHEAVWMGWSEDAAHHPVQIEMIRAMLPHVTVRLMVHSDSVRAHAAGTLRDSGVDPDRIDWILHEIPNFWTRDPGPRFLTDGETLAVADFAWNDYGIPREVLANSADPWMARRGEIDGDVAASRGLSVVATDLVAEGGGIEASGDVLISYRDVALQRNPGVPIETIEREYLRVYGKEKMVWLSRSPLADRVFAGPKIANYFGNGANGHIDEYVRFVNDSTVVVARIDSLDTLGDTLAAIDRRILLENLAELRVATDADGRPFRVIELPAPDLRVFTWTGPLPVEIKAWDRTGAVFGDFEAGDEIKRIPAVSYLNFFVTDGVVLVAAYGREGLPEREREKDEEVRRTLQALFPDREIVQIDPLAVNWSGGGMHCIVQQEPRVDR